MIQKYDLDIGKYTKENHYLLDKLEKNIKQFNNFMIEFKNQEIHYYDVVTKKDTEEKLKQEEKLMLFMINRAAIIIQRSWHNYLQKRKKKSKGKKSKKHKK